MSDTIQRAGRAVRNPEMDGLFLEMVEPWVLDIPLSNTGLDWSDPDQPNVLPLKKTSSKQERTSRASLHFVRSETCLREFIARYVDDQTESGRRN